MRKAGSWRSARSGRQNPAWPRKNLHLIMSVAHAGSVIVPDPSDKLIAPLPFSNSRPASTAPPKSASRWNFFAQTADMKGGRSLNLLNISVHFICGLCDSVVQFTGLRIIASRQGKGTHRFLEKQRGQADHGGKISSRLSSTLDDSTPPSLRRRESSSKNFFNG